MEYINTLQELEKNIERRRECIVCGYNQYSRKMLDLMYRTGRINSVCCIAILQTNPRLKEYREIPIFSYRDLPHFRESAFIIVVENQLNHNRIFNELSIYGFRNIVFIKDEVIQQIEHELEKNNNDQNILLQELSNQVKELKCRISEQNEVCAVNTNTFSPYRNAFYGKDVVILGTGPSAKYYKPLKDAIHIGLNFAWKREDISLDYLFTQDACGYGLDKRVIKELERGFDKVRDTIFVGKYLRRFQDNYGEFPDLSMNPKVKRYYDDPNTKGGDIYQDICYHPLMDFYSIVFPALHFALFTHPRKIYLVGCDTSENIEHFYEDDGTVTRLAVDRIKVGYARVKEFAKQYYPDIEIVSINPVGLKFLFYDVYTDEFPNHDVVRYLIPELNFRIPTYSKIALYGAGDQGKRIFGILMNSKFYTISAWVDKKCESIGFPVQAPECLQNLNFDCVLIAIENKGIADQVKQYLLDIGIHEEKILWFSDIAIMK